MDDLKTPKDLAESHAANEDNNAEAYETHAANLRTHADEATAKAARHRQMAKAWREVAARCD
jgi:hypothetical protein